MWFGAELSAAFTVGIATAEDPGRGTPWQMYKYDGIMGVAFPGISQTLGSAGAGGSPTAPFAVARKNGLPEVLTVVLSRVSDPQARTDDDQWNPSPGNVPPPGTRTGSVAVVGGGDLRALVAERWPYWPLPPGNKSTHPFPVPRDPRVTGDDDDATSTAEVEDGRESREGLTQLPAPLPERLLHRAMESARGPGGSSGAELVPSREGLASMGLISEEDAAPTAQWETLRGPSSGDDHRRSLSPSSSLPFSSVSQPVLPNQTDASWVRIKPTSEVGYGYWQADVAHAWVSSGVTSEEGLQPDTSADRCGGGKRQVEPSCTGIFDTGTSLLLLPGALLTDLQDGVQAAVKKAGFEPCPTVYGRLECPEDALVAAVQDLPALWITVPARKGPGASGYGAGTGLVDIGVHGIDLFNCDIQGVPPGCQFMVTGGSNVIDDHTLLLGDTFLRAYGQVYAYGNASMGLLPAVPWAKTRPSWYEPLPVVPWYKLWYVWVAVVLGIAAVTGFAACCYLQAVKKGGEEWEGDGSGGYEMGMGEEGDTYAALQGDDDGVTFGGGINGGPVYAGGSAGSGGGGGYGGPVDAAEQGGYLMPGQNSVMVDGQQVRVT